ncbi:MAG: proteasome assembly chaperone family protein [Planctomycetota bacterium]|jgi:proteasome assembly chaperone (PAC2) family protein
MDTLDYFAEAPSLNDGTLILSFSGWMDGGDASTGTVDRLISLLGAEPFAEIDPDPFYIFNFPGPMEIASLFRPEICIEDGIVQSVEMPRNEFYVAEDQNLILFKGREPNLNWRKFGSALFQLASECGVKRVMFVGSFGGTVPHTREPRMFVTCTTEELHAELKDVGLRRTNYEGPGSFMTWLTLQAAAVEIEMVSLVAEIPGYLHGPNPYCLEAITRRLARILKLSLDLDELRAATNEWEVEVTAMVEETPEMVDKIREMEDDYDRELVELEELQQPDD